MTGLSITATATAPPASAVPTPAPVAKTPDIPGKVKWMHWSEVIDSLRIVPRLLIVPMFVWSAWKLGIMLHWYMVLPPAERTGNVTAFAGVITAPICTVLGYAFKVYIGGGRNWDQAPCDPSKDDDDQSQGGDRDRADNVESRDRGL